MPMSKPIDNCTRGGGSCRIRHVRSTVGMYECMYLSKIGTVGLVGTYTMYNMYNMYSLHDVYNMYSMHSKRNMYASTYVRMYNCTLYLVPCTQ